MIEHRHLSDFARMLADPTRARIVASLMGGTALPATDLAIMADVRPSTASEHLSRLVAGGLLVVERQGRHRYYRLSGRRVATLVESIAVLSPPAGPSAPGRERLRRARTCYDHLAGDLGVALTGALVERGYLADAGHGYRAGVEGTKKLAGLVGVEVGPSGSGHALFGRKCLDWTERRHHCGGRLGAAIARAFFDARWIARGLESRAVDVLPRGVEGLRKLGVDVTARSKCSPSAGRP
ncbi:MAG TPA: metalloregulator ArsR/SmtB family transcription factor [Vicinamibacterales bacterium]|nr:metalloregulator ArsR/SmtB family transcription factor [Vicinamibacterales bacterium]